jgi:type III pantothenate kinase
VVDAGLSGIGFQIPHPEELGTDRIVNAVAAFALIRKPVVVIDAGTATTITAVNGRGEYIGGAIMPGIGLMNETLGMKTSKLREIDIAPPDAALGKDTAGCIRSGLCIGTAGAIERIVAGIEDETGTLYDMLLTGGLCFLVDAFIRRPHAVRPDLTLEGLKILYEKNRPE